MKDESEREQDTSKLNVRSYVGCGLCPDGTKIEQRGDMIWQDHSVCVENRS